MRNFETGPIDSHAEIGGEWGNALGESRSDLPIAKDGLGGAGKGDVVGVRMAIHPVPAADVGIEGEGGVADIEDDEFRIAAPEQPPIGPARDVAPRLLPAPLELARAKLQLEIEPLSDAPGRGGDFGAAPERCLMEPEWIAVVAGAEPLLDQVIAAKAALGIGPTGVGNKKPLLEKGGEGGISNRTREERSD